MKMSWKGYRRLTQIGIILIFMAPILGSLVVIGTLISSEVLGITLTDPLALLEVIVASKTVTFTLLSSSLLITAAYMVLGKAFCSWACPIGLMVELIDELKNKVVKSKQKNLKEKQTQYYWALPIFLIVSLLIGVPIFQTISPLGIFFRSILFGFGIEVIILVFIIIYEFIGVKRGWCRIFCPVGALYALISHLSVLKVQCDADKCIKCNKCVRNCSYTKDSLQQLINEPLESWRMPLCTKCGQCIDVCPTGALKFSWGKPVLTSYRVKEVAATTSESIYSRRMLLQAGGALAVTGLLTTSFNWTKKGAPVVLRPPGAGIELEFLSKCIRCGKCIEVCEYKTLLSAHGDQGMGIGTPYFNPREMPCYLCMKCPDVCPTGALAPLDIREVKIGVAEIDKELCYAYQGDVCRSCWLNCPLIDEALFMEDFQLPVVNPDKCVGCGICEYACVLDEPAIKIIFRN